MLLQLDRVTRAFHDHEVLRDASFTLDDRDRCVLLGRNGAGKSTIFRIITGEQEAETGRVILAKGKTVAHLPQFGPADDEKSAAEWVEGAFERLHRMEQRIHALEERMASGEADEAELSEYSEVLSVWQAAGGERIAERVAEALAAMDLTADQRARPLAQLSGGQRQKVYLTRLSLTSADLLLLDEPTNHLDLTGIRKLEDFVLGRSGAALLISHDTRFVRRVATRIFHLAHGKVETFEGGYGYYLTESEARNALAWKKIREQEEFVKKNRDYIAKFGAGTRSAQAQSRQKMLDKVELLDAPVSEKELRGLRFPVDEELPKDVLKVRHLRAGYGAEPVLRGADFEIIKNEKVALIGRNGAGKSTLLKSLAGHLTPLSGTVTFGARIQPSFYDQDLNSLPDDQTIFDCFMERFPKLGQEEVRTRLGTFLFSGDTVFDMIRVLSGGERGRLQLLDLLLQKPNLLVLDEPTNNLDISGISVLSNSLRHFDGALLLVSHDRDLVQEVATRILVLCHGKVINLPGRFEENRAQIEALLEKDALPPPPDEGPVIEKTAAKPNRVPESAPKESAETKAGKESKDAKKPNAFRLAQLEKKIEDLEGEKNRVHVRMASLQPHEFTEVPGLEKKLAKLDAELGEALAQWEKLQGPS